MSKKSYSSHIEKAQNYTTANGASYVTPFDVVRSRDGRELINRHAALAISLGLEVGKSDLGSNGQGVGKTKKT